jgi:exonuclease SbcC
LAETAAVAAEQARAATQALAAAADERATLDAAIAAARDAAARAERLGAEAETARTRAARATERDRLKVERASAHARVGEAIDAEQTAHAAWLDLRERRLAGMAAELAGGLEDGEPCVVCGATEHPAPAHVSRDDGSTAEREQAAERDHARTRTARSEAERTLADVERALAAAQAVAGDMPAEQLAAAATTLAEQLATARTQAATGDAARKRIDSLAAETSQHEQAKVEAAKAEATARAARAERSRALEAEHAQLAAARGDAPSVAARVETLRAHATAAEQEAAAREAGFADAGVARAALRDDAARTALAQRIRDFDAGLAERRATTEDPQLQAAAAATPPDLPALETATAAAAERDAQATRRLGLDEQRHTAVGRLAGELDDALAALAPIAERERTVRELAGLVDGSAAANRLHMRLSAYVLAARLEEVAAAATIRLERMSNGRYRLVHTDERARRERQAGLELRVVDGWTGQQRPPATLSGGETFLASLALALGLADVVAAEAGGSRLETLFVDEGFGSLDERTLDEVLDVLDRLREGGRTVGIVSHVAELRQRIPTRLRVVKDRAGSRVEHEHAALAG